MLDWSADDQDIEAQADEFASYLLKPLNDYRQQVSGPVDLDMMGHCADRYGVSLTAATLKWLSYTDEKALIVMSTDGYMKWAWSSQPALKAGAFYRTRRHTVAIPAGSITGNHAIVRERNGVNVLATVWFPHAEPQLHLREMKLYSDHYDSMITLLVLPRVATAWQPRDFEDEQ
jgi:hypothetical protein